MLDMLLTIFIYCMYAVEQYHYILLSNAPYSDDDAQCGSYTKITVTDFSQKFREINYFTYKSKCKLISRNIFHVLMILVFLQCATATFYIETTTKSLKIHCLYL